jgi:hypothetical protein
MMFFNRAKKEMQLDEVTNLLAELRLPTSLVFTPTNLESEKKKFFNSDTYSPVFQYRIVKNSNKEILKKLSHIEEISDVDPRISAFYVNLINSKKEANELMHAVGDNELVTDISVIRYGKPSAQLFRNACRVLRGKLDKYNIVQSKSLNRGKMYKYEDIKLIFEKVFKELGLEGWEVDKSMNIGKNGVKVGMKTKKILVDPGIERTEFKLRKTIIHEVGTHVLRGENGLKTGFEAFSKPNLVSYLDVEEGLATWNENNLGLLTDEWLKKKAALIYALYIGEEMSFRELYNSVSGILPKYAAFDVVYRVKRGMGDTSYPGIYSKDIAYFRGFRKVLKKLDSDPSLYELLYTGKIGFEQCEWVREGLLPRAKNVPTIERWLEIFKKVGI